MLPLFFQISKRYGVKYVDAKVAMDSAFSALGKALPEPAPPEAKAPPPAKGKKGKDSKKGRDNRRRCQSEKRSASIRVRTQKNYAEPAVAPFDSC